MVLGIYYSPWTSVENAKGLWGHRLFNAFRDAVRFKSNPRTTDYMKREFFERWPEGKLTYVTQDFSSGSELASLAAAADTIVLLYPDSIGQGFAPLERRIFATKQAWASVRVLNGRKREFLLNRRVLRALRRRRFLEVTMLGESVAVAAFLLVAPVLLIIDLVRSKA